MEFLQIEPTTRCNFTCGFCAGRHMEQGDLAFETFLRALELTPNLRHVELQGEGEPLMHPRFFDMVAACRQRGAEVSFITNGSFLSPANVERIFEHDVALISVSIESADPAEFRAIRGGKLEKVIRGLEHLMSRRAALGRTRPTVAFSIAVLKRTLDALPDIVALYRRLGLDGGISMQMLQEMEAYVSVYDEAMAAQRLTDQDITAYHARIERELPEALELVSVKRAAKGFFAALFDGWSPDTGTCAWLERGAYITKDGDVAPCCAVKDTVSYGLGNVARDTVDTIAERRDHLRQQLLAGETPRACRNCPVATHIASVRGGTRRRALRVMKGSSFDGTW